MYLRSTQRRRKDGSLVRYVQLAHNRRVGGVTQAEVLVNLGREDRLDLEGLRRLAASITRFTDGDGGGMPLAGAPERPARVRVRQPEHGRVILGRHEGALVAAEPRASVMVVAPAQAGKTTGLVVPALLEWDGPVLATSVKGDLTHDTYAARAGQGDVRIFDPTASTGLPSAGWSPVAASTNWEAARRTAARLLQVGERAGNSPDESF